MPREQPHRRADYRWFTAFQSRFADNDQYGHLNNAVYHEYFDTAITLFVIREAGFDPHGGAHYEAFADSRCLFLAPARFPDRLTVGLRVGHLGRSSARFEVALFRNDDDAAAAQGHYVSAVRLDRATDRAAAFGEAARAAFGRLRAPQA